MKTVPMTSLKEGDKFLFEDCDQLMTVESVHTNLVVCTNGENFTRHLHNVRLVKA